jgi:copper oxidase (laccase) domain-containing protein
VGYDEEVLEATEKVLPTLEIKPFSGVTIKIYGKPNDFSFIRRENIGIPFIRNIFGSLKNEISTVFAPYPITPEIIDADNELVKKYSSHPEEISGIKVYRGKEADADAVVLNNPGEAHLFAPADCMTGVIQYEVGGKRKVISSHIGLSSLFPRDKKESIISKIAEKIKSDGGTNPQIYLDFSIPANIYERDLQYEGRQSINQSYLTQINSLGIDSKLRENRYFQVDIKSIAAELFKLAGLEEVNLGTNTTEDPELFWSNFNHQGIDKAGRNLVIVSYDK